MNVLIRGSGDVASAVAHLLFGLGYRIAIHEVAQPHYIRRGMAFTDAVFEGKSALQGILAKRSSVWDDVPYMLQCGHAIPVLVADFEESVACVQPDVLIDARMRKRATPEAQRHYAPLTIGLGPNFIAGEQTHLVIETAWGDQLGAVLQSGPALPLAGEPRVIAGLGRERYEYALATGLVETHACVGQWLTKGDEVGTVAGMPLRVPVSGYVRGICHNGAYVESGAKVIEIDPRENSAGCFGLGERPMRIAEGVIHAIRLFLEQSDRTQCGNNGC